MRSYEERLLLRQVQGLADFMKREFPTGVHNSPPTELVTDTAMAFMLEMKETLDRNGLTPKDGW